MNSIPEDRASVHDDFLTLSRVEREPFFEEQPREEKAQVLDFDLATVDLQPHPELSEKALPGWIGEFICLATRHSEADPVAVLSTAMIAFCAMVGSSVFVRVGDTRHYARLFGLIVGQSSRARKGTSLSPVMRLLDGVAALGHPLVRVSPGPLSSGEGLINAVRDASEQQNDDGTPKDAGISDKRLFVTEGEMGGGLAAMRREGNTLSPVLRTAWDSGNCAPLTKRDVIKTTGAHINIIGHITRQELMQLLQSSDIWNGFSNRFLWISARRRRMIALPEPMPEADLKPLCEAFSDAVRKAGQLTEIGFTAETRQQWEQLYPILTTDRTGIYGVVTSRAEAQVVRLSLVYALLDGKAQIEPEHLSAAVALWQYCDDSAKYIFGDSHSDPDSNKILKALAQGDMTTTELNALFGGHLSGDRLRSLLADLEGSGRITQTKENSKGRPKSVFHLTSGFQMPFHMAAE